MSSEEKMTDLKKVAEEVVLTWMKYPIASSGKCYLTELIEKALLTHGNKIAEEAAVTVEGNLHIDASCICESCVNLKEVSNEIRERLKVEG